MISKRYPKEIPFGIRCNISLDLNGIIFMMPSFVYDCTHCCITRHILRHVGNTSHILTTYSIKFCVHSAGGAAIECVPTLRNFTY